MSGDALPPLREVIHALGISADKRLGQHFLFDLNLTGKVARMAGDLSACTVMEVGPGPGGLTRALLEAGARRVIAIEKDTRCLPALETMARAFPGRLEVIEGDALQTPMHALGEAPRKVVANLPYNVGTEILFRWLAHIRAWESLTLMFQKEVADRICAEPGGKEYGRLAVMVQAVAEVFTHFDIPPQAFVPPPKVVSTVIGIVPRAAPVLGVDVEALSKVTAAAFGQRRKMLRGSLKSLGGDPLALLEKAGIDPTRRAEELSVEEFCRLTHAWVAGR